MAILAFDTSSKVCTVALGNREKLLVEHTLNLDYTHSDHLLPLIKQSLEIAELGVNDLEAIGVIVGPGSFTGLRIGLTVAKGLALAAECQLFTFTSLELLAAIHWGVSEPVLTIMPAQRGEVYTGLFDCSGGRPQLQGDYFIGKIADEVSKLVVGLERFYIVGSEYQMHEHQIEKLFSPQVIKTTPFHKTTRSALLMPLVLDELMNRKTSIDIESVEPFYMRLSAAEQQRLEREKRDVEQ